ncbi:MAG: PhoH family protein [Candidatus Hydrogenedentes bacterium]|nr:PhoH family protein [Candidatus Hydrogenedentota bacterium]
MQVRIVDRGAKVAIIGDDDNARFIAELLSELLVSVRQGFTPTLGDVRAILEEAQQSGEKPQQPVNAKAPSVIRGDLRIRPRTQGQQAYLEAIEKHDMTFAIGPAGTGKTYLAMAVALSALLSKRVRRVILTRPAVEAGESLGFLPGDLEAKINPYLRPLYDALYSMVDMSRVARLLEEGRIEVAPLAFMRGRTLDQSFVVLDEAQNTTTEQMMMFLTRLGQGSRAIITGDVTQCDLPKGTISGLSEASRVLENVSEIGIVNLTKNDVVRNPIVQRIINAYDADKARREAATEHYCGGDFLIGRIAWGFWGCLPMSAAAVIAEPACSTALSSSRPFSLWWVPSPRLPTTIQ